MEIRASHPEESAAVVELWRLAEATPSLTDSPEDLRRLVDREHATCLVADLDGEIVGSVIAAFDGWRGNL